MGHIPQKNTNLDKILPFKEALRLAEQPQEGYDAGKWLFVPPWYDEYRYVLGTKGEKPVICCGINPSTAAPDDLDNTLKSVQRVALANGCDSFQMFNVYPQRATYPQDMDKERNEKLHKENMETFRFLLEKSCQTNGEAVVWAAWGTIVEMRPYLKDCLQEMLRISREFPNVRWVKAGKVSKKGHPHHPLYLRKDAPFEPFDTEDYLAKL